MTKTIDTKNCSSCKKTKTRDSFTRDVRRKEGIRHICKSCKAQKAKIYEDSSYRKIVKLEYHLKSTYKISIEEYYEMFEIQGGRCAICRRDPEIGERLEVDHDHDSGHVRQLLCCNCNSMIGYAYEDPAILAAAIAYLKKHKT